MHPIFDGPKLKWTDANVKELHRLLSTLKKYKDTGTIELRYDMAGDDLPGLNTGRGPALVWKEALDNIHGNGYLRAFCESLQKDGKPPELMAVLKAIFETEAVTDAKIVETVPLLDRKNFREKLQALSNNDSNTRVVIVRGEKQSGKTHGKLLFQKVAKENGGKPIYLKKGQVNNLDEVLAELFAFTGGFTKQRDANTTDPAWHRLVCSEFLAGALNKNANLWIAMDNLGIEGNSYHLEPEIKAFFDQLVLQMSNFAYLDHVRLMLIDYPEGDTPDLWEETVWQEDRTAQNDVDATHVMEAIEAMAKIKKVNLFKDDIREKAQSMIRDAEEEVRKAPPGQPVSRIKVIDSRLKEYFKTL